MVLKTDSARLAKISIPSTGNSPHRCRHLVLKNSRRCNPLPSLDRQNVMFCLIFRERWQSLIVPDIQSCQFLNAHIQTDVPVTDIYYVGSISAVNHTKCESLIFILIKCEQCSIYVTIGISIAASAGIELLKTIQNLNTTTDSTQILCVTFSSIFRLH